MWCNVLVMHHTHENGNGEWEVSYSAMRNKMQTAHYSCHQENSTANTVYACSFSPESISSLWMKRVLLLNLNNSLGSLGKWAISFKFQREDLMLPEYSVVCLHVLVTSEDDTEWWVSWAMSTVPLPVLCPTDSGLEGGVSCLLCHLLTCPALPRAAAVAVLTTFSNNCGSFPGAAFVGAAGKSPWLLQQG